MSDERQRGREFRPSDSPRLDEDDLDEEEDEMEERGTLAIDRAELARFVHALFDGLDDRGFVSLRAFRQFPPRGEPDRPLHIEAIGLNLGPEPIIDRATAIATRIANGGEAGVFAPPICTFTGRKGAKGSDVFEAPALSVEADQGNLEQITDSLSLILGERPTIALHSGSLWADPETGELLPKGHLHWRLSRPARGPEQQQMLRRARDIATLIAGGDPTGTPPVHPLRFPGTWNRKTYPPVMARIVEENTTTIDLANALAALEDAAQASGLETPRNVPHLAAGDLPAELAQLAEWLTFYTTEHLRPAKAGLRHDWNCVAMAIHRATDGSEAGYQLFRAWSATAPQFYTEAGCRRRWDAITGCPPTWIGARFLRRMALAHGWAAKPAEPDAETGQEERNTDEPPPGWQEARPPADEVVIPGDPLITEQVAMEAFIASFHTDLRFNHSTGSWLEWAGHYWKPDQRKLAFAWALKLCRQLARTITAKGRLVVEKVRFSAAVEQGARAMPPISTAQDDWDADLWLLGTPGGVVDLKTGILRDGERSDMITKTTACAPAATEDCPLWLKFLDDALGGDKPMISFLQRYFGYCLTGLTMEEIIVFLFGPGGAGKGTVVKTITGIMGDYAITAPMEVFTAQGYRPSEYYRADMAGKRLIVAAETEQGAYWAEAFVKEITGGDRLSGRHPFGRPFTFDPTHKPLLHGNHIPRLRGRSTAMERRLRIALFNHKPAVPDAKLKEKLQAEWPAILRWMINGCLEWQRDGLQPPSAVTSANKSYFDAQDVLGRWIEDACILSPGKRLSPTVLRTSFNTWAKANSEAEMDIGTFAEAIEQFPGAKLTRGRSKGKRWIKGLDLKPATKAPDLFDDDGDDDDAESVGGE
jgi:putative DNA primase/helicase